MFHRAKSMKNSSHDLPDISWESHEIPSWWLPWDSHDVRPRWGETLSLSAGQAAVFHGTFLGTLERLDLEKYGKMDENGLVSPGGDFEDSDLRSIWRFEFGKVVIFWNMSSWTENRELRIGIPAANYRGFRKPWVISRRNGAIWTFLWRTGGPDGLL